MDDSDSDFIEYTTPTSNNAQGLGMSNGKKLNAHNPKVSKVSIHNFIRVSQTCKRTDNQLLQQVVEWDSDSDFIEYTHELSPEKPRRQGNKKLISSGAVKSHAATKKLERATSVNPASTSSDSISSLPEFAHAAWSSQFLPTLYHQLGSSSEPWKLFTKGNEMLLIIQELVNTIYPGTKYRAKWGDRICSMVRSLLSLYFYSSHLRIPGECSLVLQASVFWQPCGSSCRRLLQD